MKCEKRGNLGSFFAVDRAAWAKACDISLNCAAVYLTFARGSGGGNRKSSWGVRAIAGSTGLSHRQVEIAIGQLIDHGVIREIRCGTRRQFALLPDFDGEPAWICLANAVIDGAAHERAPVVLCRQTRDVGVLRLFVDLAGEHDLAGEGGVLRAVARRPYGRQQIGTHGGRTVWLFSPSGDPQAGPDSDLVRAHGDQFWPRLDVLLKLGLVQWVPVLFDGSDPEATMLHPLGRDSDIEANLTRTTAKVARTMVGDDACNPAQRDRLVPVPEHIEQVAVVDVLRLRYRPHDLNAAAWAARIHQARREYDVLAQRMAETTVPEPAPEPAEIISMDEERAICDLIARYQEAAGRPGDVTGARRAIRKNLRGGATLEEYDIALDRYIRSLREREAVGTRWVKAMPRWFATAWREGVVLEHDKADALIAKMRAESDRELAGLFGSGGAAVLDHEAEAMAWDAEIDAERQAELEAEREVSEDAEDPWADAV